MNQQVIFLVYRAFVIQKDEDMIVDAVANVGPVSICYDVAMDFRFYKKGVYKRHDNNNTYIQLLSGLSLVKSARMETKM